MTWFPVLLIYEAIGLEILPILQRTWTCFLKSDHKRALSVFLKQGVKFVQTLQVYATIEFRLGRTFC